MLYETLLQPEILFWIVLTGFLTGIVFDVAKFICFLCENNKVVRFILDIVATFFACFVLFCVVLKLSYGEIRVWHILCFFASLLFERASIGKLVAKALGLCYNLCISILKWLANRFQICKRKGGKKENEKC